MASREIATDSKRRSPYTRCTSVLGDALHQEGNRSLNYREMAFDLAEHVRQLGFTHVEFMPVMEHPFFGSWGYQTTGYFAPTSRYGTPQDFKFLIDHLHQQGIGVILDWVPSHFPTTSTAWRIFDGTHLYEHADPRQRVQPDWNSYLFNYGRSEVRSFLISASPILARGISCRRPARRCGRQHAVPRLLAQSGRMDSQQVRRARKPRSRWISCGSSTRPSTRGSPTCKLSPKNPPPGPWSRARLISAAWASV